MYTSSRCTVIPVRVKLGTSSVGIQIQFESQGDRMRVRLFSLIS